MEEALYSELGFFNTDNVRSSKKGDFLTSPEVSKYFGVIIRNWINSKNFYENIMLLIDCRHKMFSNNNFNENKLIFFKKFT